MLLRLGEEFDALESLAAYPRTLLQSPLILAPALRSDGESMLIYGNNHPHQHLTHTPSAIYPPTF